ncbi:MAG: TonB-dependent siderophore receptor [Rhizobacter sp.]
MHHRSFQPGPLTAVATACVIATLSSIPSIAAAQVEAPASAASTPSAALPAVTIRAQTDRTRTEGTGAYNTGAVSTGTRLDLSPRETPQSVTVVTRQQMDDLGIQSIEDIASSVTGLSLSRGATERGSVFSRGFSISYYTQDGLPMSSSADTLGFATLAMYDRVEVLRGAAGMMTGVGNPSGTLNLARKRPTRDTRVAVEGSIGRWDNYRAQVDAGGPLNDAGTLRGRVVAAYQDSDTFISNYGHQRGLVYGTLEADLTPDTTVSVAFHKNSEKNPGSSWYGLGTQANGAFYPGRDLTTAPDWTYWNKENTRVFAEVEQRLPKGWKVRLAAQALNDQLDSVVNGFDRASPGSYNLNLISANVFQYDRDQRAVDLSATGPFELLGRRHEVVAGMTYRSLDQDDLGWRAATPPGYSHVFDPVNWNPADAPRPDISQFYYGQNTKTEQGSVYTTARLSLTPEFSVLGGARWDTFKYEAVNVVTAATTASYQVEELTPYLGVVYDFAPQWSVYGSWTSVFNPQTAKTPQNAVLDPVTGDNLEAGIKGELMEGKLNVSAALFQIKQQNLAVSLPVAQCGPGQTSCSEAAGEVEAKGVELEAVGAPMPGWQLSAGYTFTTAKTTKGNNAGARFAPDRPLNLLRLTTMHTVPGPVTGLRLGAAVRAQSAVTRVGNVGSGAAAIPYRIHQGGYTTADLLGSWQVTRNLDLRAAITNVFDREYYQSIGTPTGSNSLGEPRSFLVTARYTFQ